MDQLHVANELNSMAQEISLSGLYTTMFNDTNKQNDEHAHQRYEDDMRAYQEELADAQIMEQKAQAAAAQRKAAFRPGRR